MTEISAPANAVPLTLPGRKLEEARAALPRLLQDASRAAGGPPDPFVNEQVVAVEAVYDLSPPARGEVLEPSRPTLAGDRLLALEAADGTTLFVRADKLRDDLLRLHPEAVKADGSVDLGVLRDRDAASRGLADWVWSKLSVLEVRPDALIEEAKEKVLELAAEWLGDQVEGLRERLQDLGASWLGTRALMAVIESRLTGEGLYPWGGGTLDERTRLRPGDPGLARAAEAGPLLVFVHGTASHTAGSFGALPATGGAEWARLVQAFGGRVYGYEHATFSASPVDNALTLARTLPKGARVCLVTHSRGGLVGDLLCLGKKVEDLVKDYRRGAPPTPEKEAPWQAEVRERVGEAERAKLRELIGLVRENGIRVERYVRVACPARGTTLLSDNLDLFLSGLLNLLGLVTGAAAHPTYRALRRIVLEIAQNRVRPDRVPGLEAMLTDSPLAQLLGRAARRPETRMAVIAGDIEGGHLLRRLGVMLTDWMFFDEADNDLVVDTESMYAGLASAGSARYLFLQEPGINHFSYFSHPVARGALTGWLTSAEPDKLSELAPLEGRAGLLAREDRARARSRERTVRGFDATRPVVVLLPGIMGSHLEIRDPDEKPGKGDRIWFDPVELAWGGLGKIRYRKPRVQPEDLFDRFYGDLAGHLEATHEVVRFPYDWRRPISDEAARLADSLRGLLARTAQPIRILAHSIGGLVARAMIALDAGRPAEERVWSRLVARPGARFVMLGTPNNGSHLMVEALLGKADTMRMLEKLDFAHNLQQVLDIVAEYRGALQLLPRPGFQDTGGEQENDYLQAEVWRRLKEQNSDRWYGDRIAGQPGAAALEEARSLWRDLLKTNTVPDPEVVAYVFGKAERTPCGLRQDGRGLKILGTPLGDGSVTWRSGQLDNLPASRCWYMPVDHGALTDTREHFPAIVELLETGSTRLLPDRPPVARAAAAERPVPYDAGPPVLPGAEELACRLLGGRLRKKARRSSVRTLQVGVRAMDLRFADRPILCGHYRGDAISGAEAQIDCQLVGGELTRRKQLGLYAEEVGQATIVLQARSDEDRRRGSARGAIIVGLGDPADRLTMGVLTETVRAGVLRFLLSWLDRDQAEATAPRALTLGSLLLGTNSTTHISIEDSMAAVALGVCEANEQFSKAMGPGLHVGRLELIELYLDAARTAAHAAGRLGERLRHDLRRLYTRIEADPELGRAEGGRARLWMASGYGYWPRLLVTDGDRRDDLCPPVCYEVRRTSPMPVERCRELLHEEGTGEAGQALARARRPSDSVPIVYAERLHYLLLGERARAEAQVHQRQPGLIETLVRHTIRRTAFDDTHRDLCRSLFQLMVPLDLKPAARQLERLVLVVDGYTANLPWEMLVAEDEPLVLRTATVRQLASTRYRARIQAALGNLACVVGNPSTAGFAAAFPDPARPEARDPDPLDAAEREAEGVVAALRQAGYEVLSAIGQEVTAEDVITRLFKRPYRVLHIAAHGTFNAIARDGKARSGVILSDGMVLTAAEVGQMEVVPELVFLNCCHLAKADPMALPADVNRLAYSLARELIEMGVRCVVAAGWAVDDGAAKVFAERFYEALLKENRPFGEAVHQARRAAWEARADCNTWGAYQAYGDPGYRMAADRSPPVCGGGSAFVDPDELLEAVEQIRIDIKHDRHADPVEVERCLRAVLGRAPAAWRERADLQCKLGELYAGLGPEYFEPARAAYLRALAGEDAASPVPIRAVEQLANLEARSGGLLAASDQEARREEGLRLAERAIARLNALCGLGDPDMAATTCAALGIASPERWALLGSAWKSKAAALVGLSRPWAAVAEALGESRGAYARGGGDPEAGEPRPLPLLNRLQLDGVLGGLTGEERDRRVEAAHRCAERARETYARTGDFFDAVVPAEAEMTVRLFEGRLADATDDLVRTYEGAVATVPRSVRQLDAVARRLGELATFLEARGDAAEAATLRAVAARLGGREPGGADRVGLAPASAPPGDAEPTDPGGSGGRTVARARGGTRRQRPKP